MIARLRGVVLERGTDRVVVDVHGVGYLVHVVAGADLPAAGEVVELHTSLQVREDSMTLYGFATAAERELFELLLTSSGVGPRIALAALATHRPQVLRTAVATEDIALLTQVPGIGRKVAERLILELQDKVGALAAPLDGGGPGVPAGVEVDDSAFTEARDALVTLGYGLAEAHAAVSAAAAEDAAAVTEDLVRAALRALAGDGVRR